MTKETGPSAHPPEPPFTSRLTRLTMIVMGVGILAVMVLRMATGYRDANQLPVLGAVPEFTLTDQNGEAFRSVDVAGKVWLASFIYTTCPGPCPRIVQKVAEVARRMGAEPDFALVSFSVDPEADTPEVLEAYARTHAIDGTRWKLVTGDAADLLGLVRTGFMLPVARAEGLSAEELAEAGPVIHSVRLVLVDQALRVRAYYDSGNPADIDRLERDARGLLRGGGW